MNMAVTYKHIDEMKPWSDKLHLLECISVTPETPDVMTFLFRSEDQNWFRYLPGQFVTLELPVGKEPLYRTYTLSSSPSRPYALSVTVKAQATSIGTRWMFDNLKPGMKIRALGPLGDFSYVRHPGDKYLFISAGSGVTPMMSMVRDMSDRAPQSDIAFINCSRSPSDIVFRHELEYLARFMPKLSLGFIVENCGRTDLWSGLKGMVDKAKIALLSPDFMDRTVFCCGPEPFMAAIRSMLDASGFDMSRYHQESFSPAAPVAVGESIHTVADGEALSMVGFTLSGKEVPCQPGQTVLMTARAAGVRIGAACESGICGTCRVLKLSGEVEMNHNGGILDDEIDEGYILACCSRPLTDVKVEA
ncbi:MULTISPECIES: hybrid-cluster NAD(P)-dependent oxidoreductase [Rhizobium/Agrobacterium group]|jgi:ferredoxin-NADP reductase|uniref:Hybrid-cluster NAD(P)-dependent oxidoreductase n=1 Tax=Agrobacterium tumefaciens TaxID=358 RepID=A0A1B9UJC6_AGRTU|nr:MULTISPECIES: hybrid-cluster NAD(P)-dependent oxidoreductase [Rhizobium/Agrobacterium group]QDG92396.1 hybrid-cluster NAD(P)-dependent oxidoreductase [Rhizobium sp. NIBRBAC000502774]ADY63657.1 ferredoxin I [Agrobacterium tumefaciens]AYM09976.1 ferredoxin I [Agrobacterium tumefaciens]KAA3508416.1 hybrid-cluster NAD(P)-dependent oxidoreductase [Agrobacterium tumefaciens]KAA3531007.1 hybrid-cluster NAD(P)-dependent oxidoreductase [Agrobacterium tumefaciens]